MKASTASWRQRNPADESGRKLSGARSDKNNIPSFEQLQDHSLIRPSRNEECGTTANSRAGWGEDRDPQQHAILAK